MGDYLQRLDALAKHKKNVKVKAELESLRTENERLTRELEEAGLRQSDLEEVSRARIADMTGKRDRAESRVAELEGQLEKADKLRQAADRLLVFSEGVQGYPRFMVKEKYMERLGEASGLYNKARALAAMEG